MAASTTITFPPKEHNHDSRYQSRKIYDISTCKTINVIATHATPYLYIIDNLGIFFLDAHINIKTDGTNKTTSYGYCLFDNLPVHFSKLFANVNVITSQKRTDSNGLYTNFYNWFGQLIFKDSAIYFDYNMVDIVTPAQVNCPFRAIGFFDSFNSNSPATT